MNINPTELSHFLPKGVLLHTKRVEIIATELAETHGVDIEKVQVAALFHDLARAKHPDKLLKLAKQFGLTLESVEENAPILMHGPIGAEFAKRNYGVLDHDVIQAIQAHTTGSGNLGKVARIIFLADKLDPSKDKRYPFNPIVRDLASQHLERAILAFIDGDISRHLVAGRFIHPNTIEFRNDLINDISCDKRLMNKE